MNRILVAGATGNVGGQVVRLLSHCTAKVRAMVRNPEAAELPRGIEIVRGDLTAPQSLDAALDGIDSVFLVWTAAPDAVGPALERIARYARRIVLLTSPHKTPHPFFQQPNPIRLLHAQIERLIEDSGLEWTFLRPGMLAANARLWWAPQIRAGNVVRWPYATVATAPIHERDIAAVAVRALCEPGHAGADYVLTGPEALTHAGQVETIGSVIGRPLRFEEIPFQEAPRELLATIPAAPIVNMLLDAWAAAAGHAPYMTSSVEEITGAPARTFRQWVIDNAAVFAS